MTTDGGDVQRALIGIAKRAVGGRIDAGRHRMHFQDAAGRVPNVDHGTGAAGVGARRGHDVAIGVKAHAVNAPLRTPMVRAELMQHGVRAERAIFQNVVTPQLAQLRAGLNHVQRFFVCGYQ